MTLDLWEFQKEDLERFKDEPAVLAAWEMGTGKTRFGIARDLQIRENASGWTLVIAPLSTHQQWVDAFTEFTNLTCIAVDRKNRHSLLKNPAHVYVVHWEGLRLMPQLKDIDWLHVIADEVHRAKNKDAVQTKAFKKLRTKWKTGLSGTPATSKPQDLWSILNWIDKRTYSSFWKYFEQYVEYEVEYKPGGGNYRKMIGVKNIEHLQDRISPFFSRHLKKEACCEHHPNGVMPWLPDKYYRQIWVDLHPQQRKAYDQMQADMLAWVGEHEDEPIAAPVVISQLVKLQQFALGYLEPRPDGSYDMTEPSAKLDALVELLKDNPDEQIVVYSQWKAPLYMTKKRLEKEGISCATYTGDDSGSVRASNKQSFISGSSRVLLGTVGAGGVGVDGLQSAAATLVFLDRAWSPADNNQAEDRLWRGGQERGVQIVDIMARSTVDLGRHQRIEKSWGWIRALLGDNKPVYNALGE